MVVYMLLMKNQLDAILGQVEQFFFYYTIFNIAAIAPRKLKKVLVSAYKLHKNLILVSKYMFLMSENVTN